MRLRHLALAAALLLPQLAHAQASAIPTANPDADDATPDKGRKLLDQMVQALGGDKWLGRTTWLEDGQTAHFYKGKPDPYVVGFETYYRANPYAQRVIHVVHGGSLTILGLPGHDMHDTATVWTEQGGWDITYKGKAEVPKEDFAEFVNVRRHSLEVVIGQWLKEPGVLITYEGTDMVERRLAQRVSIVNAANDTVTIELQEGTHLPLSLTWKSRNDTYKDYDTETQEYDDYHDVQGLMTAMTLTRFKNGDMVSQRFLKKVDYGIQIAPDLFDPDRPLEANPKKK